MYAKRTGEARIECLAAPYLLQNGRIYTNPSDAQLRAAGYKPLVDRPGEKEPTCPFTIYYEEDDDFIYTCYREEAQI